MNLFITPKIALRSLLALVAVLLLANFIAIIAKLYFPGLAFSIMGYFDFDRERNVPTFFSAIILLLSAVLLYMIVIIHRKSGKPILPWLILCLIFAFFALDEIASLHEILGRKVRAQLNTTGVFYFGWVIPYGIAIIIFCVLYIKFLLSLSKRIRILFILSGAIYVIGAMGMEMPGGWYSHNYGEHNLVYSLIYTLEELLEMVGISVFIYTLLTYMASEFGSVELKIKE